MKNPDNLKYSKSHEWVLIEGDTATMGITEFAVSQLGDVTLVELPEPGEEVKAGDAMGTIESVKAVSDLYSPVTGKVIAINTDLEDDPEKVNDDPYVEGWMAKIELTSDNFDNLMDSSQYDEYLDSLD
ncbi:MAG: glycine cleavage system protein GcvH [Deltaproteobacteria bacterium]|nr:glycine cleavage system protein GcvH [Deltaproteobacteria bacterium]